MPLLKNILEYTVKGLLSGVFLYTLGDEGKKFEEKRAELAEDQRRMNDRELALKTMDAAAHGALGGGAIPFAIQLWRQNPGLALRLGVRAGGTFATLAMLHLASREATLGDNMMKVAEKTGDQKMFAEGIGKYISGTWNFNGTSATIGLAGVAMIMIGVGTLPVTAPVGAFVAWGMGAIMLLSLIGGIVAKELNEPKVEKASTLNVPATAPQPKTVASAKPAAVTQPEVSAAGPTTEKQVLADTYAPLKNMPERVASVPEHVAATREPSTTEPSSSSPAPHEQIKKGGTLKPQGINHIMRA